MWSPVARIDTCQTYTKHHQNTTEQQPRTPPWRRARRRFRTPPSRYVGWVFIDVWVNICVCVVDTRHPTASTPPPDAYPSAHHPHIHTHKHPKTHTCHTTLQIARRPPAPGTGPPQARAGRGRGQGAKGGGPCFSRSRLRPSHVVVYHSVSRRRRRVVRVLPTILKIQLPLPSPHSQTPTSMNHSWRPRAGFPRPFPPASSPSSPRCSRRTSRPTTASSRSAKSTIFYVHVYKKYVCIYVCAS